MNKIHYKILDKVNIERFEEGAIITVEKTGKIISLGKLECEIFDTILENDFAQVLFLLSNKYDGDTIQSDITEFCDRLCSLNVLDKEDYE